MCAKAVLRENGTNNGDIPGGVLVKRIEPTSPASELLRERDVLLSIAGRSISTGARGSSKLYWHDVDSGTFHAAFSEVAPCTSGVESASRSHTSPARNAPMTQSSARCCETARPAAGMKTRKEGRSFGSTGAPMASEARVAESAGSHAPLAATGLPRGSAT